MLLIWKNVKQRGSMYCRNLIKSSLPATNYWILKSYLSIPLVLSEFSFQLFNLIYILNISDGETLMEMIRCIKVYLLCRDSSPHHANHQLSYVLFFFPYCLHSSPYCLLSVVLTCLYQSIPFPSIVAAGRATQRHWRQCSLSWPAYQWHPEHEPPL